MKLTNYKKEREGMSEVKVEQIVIKIGEREVVLNIEEAKELKKVLDDLFNTTIVTYPVYPYYYGNWRIGPAPSPKYDYGTIMCAVGDNLNNGFI